MEEAFLELGITDHREDQNPRKEKAVLTYPRKQTFIPFWSEVK